MSDNLVGKLDKELQKLAFPTASEPPSAKLSRAAILAQLDDDVYNLVRTIGVSSSMSETEILKKFGESLKYDTFLAGAL
nr:unnamed protein product [Spirometra erinaceieuropaei]